MLFENVARHMFCQEYILLVRVFRSSAADGDGILHIEEPAVIQVFYGTFRTDYHHQTSLLLGTRA